MTNKQLKPLLSIRRPDYIPVEERGTITLSELKPGLNLSKYIKDSHLTFLSFLDDEGNEIDARDPKSRSKVAKFRCELCGTIITRSLKSVVRGTTRSCGCMGRYESIKPGEKFGYLTVLDEEPKIVYRVTKQRNASGGLYSQRKVYYPVKCQCGNKTYVDPRSLRNGLQISCSKCFHPEIPDSYKPELHKICTMLGKRYDKIRTRTVAPDSDVKWVNYTLRGITLDIKLHDFIRAFYKQNIDFENTQIDRIDGNKSYTLDNIRWVSAKENANNLIPLTSYTELTVSYRLFTDARFRLICNKNQWVYDQFIKIEFPFKNQAKNSDTFNLYVKKFGIINPVKMVYYYIDIAKRVSDVMKTDLTKRYLRLVDENGEDVVRTDYEWKDTYKVIFS